MRALLLGLLLVVSVNGGLQAQNQKSRNTVTLELDHVSLQTALERLCSGTGKVCIMDDNMATAIVPKVSIKDGPFDLALKLILKSVDLKFTQTDGVYVIGPREIISPALAPDNCMKPQDGDSPVNLVGKSRYDIKNLLGKPDRIEYTRIAGCESWIYGDEAVVFANCKVDRIESLYKQTSVSAGFKTHSPNSGSAKFQTRSANSARGRSASDRMGGTIGIASLQDWKKQGYRASIIGATPSMLGTINSLTFRATGQVHDWVQVGERKWVAR